MKKIIALFLAVASVFSLSFLTNGVSASETTTTQAPTTSTTAGSTTEEQAKDKTSGYIKYTNVYDFMSEKWIEDNSANKTTIENEVKTLKATYSSIELITLKSGLNGKMYFIEITDKPYKSYVLMNNYTEETTKTYLLATLKDSKTKLVFNAPSDLTTDSLTFTKNNESVTIAISKTLYNSADELASYTFSDKINKYSCTLAEKTSVEDSKKIIDSKEWKQAKNYKNDKNVINCLKALEKNDIEIPFDTNVNLWNQVLMNTNQVGSLLLAVGGLFVSLVLVIGIIYGAVRFYKWLA